MRFRDLQTGDFSAHTTLDGLFEMLCEGFCECGDGYDRLDEKDGKLKCTNCWRLNNMDKISKQEMRQYIQSHEYEIQDNEYTDKELEELWEEFGDIPMNPKTECMEGEFLHFPIGTHREDIWHWFDEKYSLGVYYLLYPNEREDDNYEEADN
jgi:hypothetical protein